MAKISYGLALVALLAFSTVAEADQWVNGYFRSDGTYVSGYYRSDPDGNPYNNYSTYPNVNPYTGQVGTHHVSPYDSYGSPYSYPSPYSSPYDSGSQDENSGGGGDN